MPSEAEPEVTITLSRPAAVFLRGTVEYMNRKKILPTDDLKALKTSAWLEEIEARTDAALSPQAGAE